MLTVTGIRHLRRTSRDEDPAGRHERHARTPTRSTRIGSYGGAGLDVLIGNTGGDRLIDWVGEFNCYIVPFAPFGIATVSRQVPPQLSEFLYALSATQGADPTRDEDHERRRSRRSQPATASRTARSA